MGLLVQFCFQLFFVGLLMYSGNAAACSFCSIHHPVFKVKPLWFLLVLHLKCRIWNYTFMEVKVLERIQCTVHVHIQ